jgi:hypothetical protein
MVTEVGQLSSVNAFMGEINSCSSAQYSKDARMLSYNGDETYCQGSVNASVTIQNYSVGAALTECNILTQVNGSTVDAYDWSGNLDTYETATIDLGTISGIPDNADVSFEIDYSGDMDESNNDIDPDISGSEESSTYVTLTVLTDDYPDETSWQLFDADGDVVASTNVVGQAYGQAGDYSGQANTSIEIEWTLEAGCYTFSVYDAYGDGVNSSQWGGTDGLITLTDAASGNVFFSIWDGFDIASVAFDAGALSSIEDNQNTEISLFPNPTQDNVNIYINSKSNEAVNIEVYNNLGKVVYNTQETLTQGANTINMNLDNLLPGLYYVNTVVNGESNLKPLTIVK